MACKFWTHSAFVLIGISFVGCKTGPSSEPLRVDSMFNRQSANAEQSLGGASNSVSVKQSAKDYFTDSRLAQSVPDEDTNVVPSDGTKMGSIRHAASKVQNAFTIKPKVVPAADPTDLRYDPGPIQPSLYLSAAALHEQSGQLKEAAEKYERLLEVNATHREALVGLGRLKHRQGDLQRAIEIYSTAAKHYGDDPVVLNDLGLCLARAGRSQEAIVYMQNAIQLKPDSLLYRNNLAAILVESNRPHEAVTTLEKSYGPAVAHYNVGYLLKEQGKSQEATTHFVEALRINPTLEPARRLLDQLNPQIGTLPTHMQSAPPSTPLRTSQANPMAAPTTAASPNTVVPAQHVSVSQPAQPTVVPATYHEPAHATNPVKQATYVPTPEPAQEPIVIDDLIRLPKPRKVGRDATGLVPPSPETPGSVRRPGFLPIAE